MPGLRFRKHKSMRSQLRPVSKRVSTSKLRTPKACDDDDCSGVGPAVGRDVYSEERPVLFDAQERPLRRAIGFTAAPQVGVAPKLNND